MINGTTYEPVTDITTNKPIEIPAGELPISIAFREDISDDFEDHSTIYVVNRDSNTVSAISAENNTKIKDIPVGDNPTGIEISSNSDTIYVANSDSNTVSVIDGIANEILAGVTFQVSPFNSGVIRCDGLTTPSPVGQYVYVYSGAQCTADPNAGFEFVSWEENNLSDNSSQTLSVWRPSYLDSFFKFFNPNSDIPEAKLNVTKFGTFTANFRELPPPLPPEFWAQMYAVIGTVVTALFIPTIVGWFKSKRDAKKFNYFHKQITAQEGKLDENDIEKLDDLRNSIGDAHSEGKLNDKHYESLRDEVSTLHEEIFRKKIAALDNGNKYSVVKKPVQEQ